MVRRKAATTTTSTTEGDTNTMQQSKLTASQQDLLQTLFHALGNALGITNGAVAGDDAPAKTTPAKKAPAAKTVADPVPDDADDSSDRRAELTKKTIAALRTMAIDLGFEEADVKKVKDKSELIDAIIEGESEDADADDDEAADEDADDDADEADDDDADEDADEDDDAGDDDDSAEEDTRESLSGMPLRALRKHVADNYDTGDEDVTKMSKTDIVDWLFPEDDEDADDDDAAEDDDDQDDDGADDGDDDDALTEEDLQEMSIAQLKTTVKEYGGKVPTGTVTKKSLIKMIMDLADVEF